MTAETVAKNALMEKRLTLSEVEGRGALAAMIVVASDLILRRRSG